MSQGQLDRRQFLISASLFAGGMAITMLPARVQAAAAGGALKSATAETELSPWISIAHDDWVTVRSPVGEIGNGAMTQTAMTITEELGCDWSKVRVEFASARRDYLENGVYSAGFLPFFAGHGTDDARMKRELQLGASARERLKAAAAARWQVSVDQIEVRKSVLKHLPTNRTLRYGEVAAEAASIQLPAEPQIKPQETWTFLGKESPAKLHLHEVVTGTAIYGIDVKVPGMVHAALMQTPVHGGRLKHHDPKAVLNMPGVRAVIVVDPAKTKGSPVKPRAPFGFAPSSLVGAGSGLQSGVAVIADHYWQAKKALEALPLEWETGQGSAWTSIEQIYDAAEAVLEKGDGTVSRKTGDVNAVKPVQMVEATYCTPFCDNAVMEPLNATVLVTPDKAEIWHPGQDQQQTLWVTVDETGLPPEKVFVHQTLVGGGFGRRTQADDARMAVAIAREYPGVPVKVIWTREEVTRQGRYRTAITTRLKAGLDANGLPAALWARACFAGLVQTSGYSDIAYVLGGGIPNAEMTISNLQTHILTGAYRGPGYNSHAFMVESFIDECASAAKIDPLEYRLQLLANADPSWSKCLKVAAQKAGWGKSLPKGKGMGIAVSNWFRKGGSTVCAVARVDVSKDGVLHVEQIDVAFDCGRIVNRDAVAAQIEGATIFGLNMTLNEELTVRDGAVVEGNFDNYPMLRIGDVPPKINIHFDALSGENRFGWVGEAPVGPVGPAVANAIFQATGKRLRTTPLRKHDLSWT